MHLEEAHVGVPHRHRAVGGADVDAEQAARQGEEPIEHARQGEVRAQRLFIVAVAAFAQAFAPETDVPITQLEARVAGICAGEGGEVSEIPFGMRARSASQLGEQLLDLVHALRHLEREAEIGVGREAEQARLLAPRGEDALDERAIVMWRAGGAGDIGAVQALAQIAALRRPHER